MDEEFRLNDGVGMQAFIVVASRTPLPSYEDWKARRAAVRWQTLPAKEGVVWHGDGVRLNPVWRDRDQRGEVVRIPWVTTLEELFQELRSAPGVEALDG
jgi:hypothetical protein